MTKTADRENYVAAMQSELSQMVHEKANSNSSVGNHQNYSSKHVMLTAQSHSTRDQSNGSA